MITADTAEEAGHLAATTARPAMYALHLFAPTAAVKLWAAT